MHNEVDNDSDPYERRLAAYDDAIAAGRSVEEAFSESETDPELADRFQRAQSCLAMLERVWPRSDASRSRDATEPLSGQAELLVGQRLTSTPPSDTFGDFRILREIGRGGMGVVYESEQISLGRRVALKLIPLGALFDDRQLQRFQNEARAAALLDHPHIVKVYTVGREGSVPFYAMQLIDGQTLAALITAQRNGESPAVGPLPNNVAERFRMAAELGIQACEALEHAHAQGIVHRDVKPANLLVGPVGHLWIADFGLARIGNDPGVTATGDVLGTVRYMSPEQATGKRLIDHRADIYALGASLYEWVALKPMFPEVERLELMQSIMRDTARPSLSRDVPEVPRDLETILLKATAKEPAERYETAQQMAEDLRCFLEHRPISARRASVLDRLVKWSRRNDALITASLGTAALVLVGALFLLWREQSKTSDALVQANLHLNTATFERSRAESAAKRQSELSDELRDRLYASDMKLADQAKWASNSLTATEILRRYFPIPGQLDQRGFEWHYLWRQTQREPVVVQASAEPVYHAAYSPDGRLVATAGKDAIVRVFEKSNLQLRFELETGQLEVNGVAFSPDGQRLASTGDDGTVRVWDIASRREVFRIAAHPTKAYQVVYTSDAKQLISCGEDTNIRIWDAAHGATLGEISTGHQEVEAIALTRDGSLCAVGDQGFTLWNVAERRLVDAHGYCGTALSVATCFDGSIAFGCSSGKVLLREPKSNSTYLIAQRPDPVVALCFSPDGRQLAMADRGGGVAICTTDVGIMISNTRVHWAGLSPRGETVALASGAHVVMRNLKAGTNVVLGMSDPRATAIALGLQSEGRPCPVYAFSPDGNQFVCVNEIHRRLAGNFHFLAKLHEDPRLFSCCEFSTDSTHVITGMSDGRVCVWNAADGQLVATLTVGSCVNGIACSSDGQLLAIAAGREVQVWDFVKREKLLVFDKHQAGVSSVRFSPDGGQIASADWEGRICIWQTRSGAGTRELPSVSTRVDSIAWSPNGRWLASTGGDFSGVQSGHTRLWDVSALRLVEEWSGLLNDANVGFWWVNFHGSDHLFVSGNRMDCRLLRTNATDQQNRSWQGHAGRAFAITCPYDSQEFTSVGSDGALKVWPEAAVFDRLASDLHSNFALTKSGEILVANNDGEVECISPLATSESLSPQDAHWYHVAISPDNLYVAIATNDSAMHFLDWKNRKSMAQFQVPNARGRNAMVFSPDSKMLVVTPDSDEPVTYLFSVPSWKIVGTLPTRCVNCFPAISRDGRLLATKSNNDVLVWDVHQRRQMFVLRGHTSTINALAFSPNQDLLVSASSDRSLRLWDITSGVEKFSVRDHLGEIWDVAFSPDGRTLASCDDLGVVKLWSVSTGQPFADIIRFEESGVSQLQFSADGRRLFWRTHDGVLKVCDPGRMNEDL